MDVLGENVPDNDKYAFLLGTALKNEDLEQFFCVYDSILPSNIPTTQLDAIKEQARLIAELPEDDFNDLVVSARDFSLAKGRPRFPASAMSSSGRHSTLGASDDHSDEDEDSCNRGERFARKPFPPVQIISDNESGLSKTVRRPSVSSDSCGSDMEREGAFDYFPPPLSASKMHQSTRIHESVKITHSYNPYYEAEINIESDKSSVESPRSDASSAREYDVTHLDLEDLPSSVPPTELTTFRQETCDYKEDEDCDENPVRNIRTFRPAMRGSWDDIDSSRASSTVQFSTYLPTGQEFSSIHLGRKTTPAGASRSSNKPIVFTPHATRFTGDNICPNYKRGSPPFSADTSEELLDKVGKSVSRLFTCSSSAFESMSAENSSIDGKKKKKKKKDTKDETPRDGAGRGAKPSMNVDVNGNPLDNKHNTQMREAHRQHESSLSIAGPRVSRSYGVSNQHEISGGGGGPHHSDTAGKAKPDDTTSSTNSSISSDRAGRKHKKVRKAQVTQVPENYPGYVGDKLGLDNLVKFITHNISQKTLKKLSQCDSCAVGAAAVSSSAVSSAAPSSGKGPKSKKDRIKAKHSAASKPTENQESSPEEGRDGLSPSAGRSEPCSSDTSILTASVDSQCGDLELTPEVGSDVEEVVGEMGNSSSSEKPRDQNGFDLQCAGSTESAVFTIKNNHLSKKQSAGVATQIPQTVSEETRLDIVKNHKNHALNNSIKNCSSNKQEIISATKESKDRAKSKSAGKDGMRNDSTSVQPTDSSSKKPKAKPLNKSESKSETAESSTVKSGFLESKEANGDKDANKTKTPQSNVLPVVSVLKHETNSALDMDGEGFIFTDVDLPHREQEFTVVSGKKKKRSPFQSQGQHSGVFRSRESQQSPYFVSVATGTRNGPREIHSRPQFPKARSCTPPPYSAIGTSEPSEPSCDLSPSAFPVLRKSTKTGPKIGSHVKEHRRRSLEDLSLDTGPLLGYESDRESVKSLPASKGSTCGRILAYPVSYASKAATPRPSVDSSKAESVASSTEGGGSREWHSPVVWKGNMQERRHSIGSSPEDCSKVTAGIELQGTRPKSGSQELVPRDSGNSSDRSARICLLPGSKNSICDSTSTGSFVDAASGLSDADLAQGGSEVGSDPAGDVFVPSVSPSNMAAVAVTEDKAGTAALNSRVSSIPAGDVVHAAHRTTPNTMGQSTSPHYNSSTIPTVSSCTNSAVGALPSAGKPKYQQQAASSQSPASSCVPSPRSDVPVRAAVPVSKGVNNGRKNKNSVIFLDKRFLKPTDLDISFGFDINLVMSDSSQQQTPDCFSSETCVAPVVNSSSMSTDKDTLPANEDIISSATDVSSVRDRVSSANEAHPLTSKNSAATVSMFNSTDILSSSAKPAKGPHISGLNGLVVRQRAEVFAAAELSSPAAPSFLPSCGVGDDAPKERSTVSKPVGYEDVPPATSDGNTGSAPPDVPLLIDSVPGKPVSVVPEGCVTFRYGEDLVEVSQLQFPGKVRESAFFMSGSQESSNTSTFNLGDAASYFQKEWDKLLKLKEKDPKAVLVYCSE